MVKVSVGDVIPLTEVKTGEKNGNPWMLMNLKAERGYDSVTLFIHNCKDAKRWKNIRVAKILSVTKSKRQYNGQYYDSYSCTIEVEDADNEASVKSEGFNRFQSALGAMQPEGNSFVGIPNEQEGLPFT